MHAKNDNNDIENNLAYKYGNPYSLLKIQRLLLDPLTPENDKEKLVEKAKSLGLDECKSCPGCKCGVGIDLKNEVIQPLLNKIKG